MVSLDSLVSIVLLGNEILPRRHLLGSICFVMVRLEHNFTGANSLVLLFKTGASPGHQLVLCGFIDFTNWAHRSVLLLNTLVCLFLDRAIHTLRLMRLQVAWLLLFSVLNCTELVCPRCIGTSTSIFFDNGSYVKCGRALFDLDRIEYVGLLGSFAHLC